MNRNPAYFKLGLFVLVSFGLTAAFLIVFGAGTFMKKELIAETCFDESVQGLEIGSEVKYKGMRIGTVKSITNPAEVYDVASNYVLVTFTISENCYVGQTGADNRERLQKALEQGLEIQLTYKGITGGAFLETDYYEGEREKLALNWTPSRIHIPSRKSDIQAFSEAVRRTLNDFSKVDLDQAFTHATELLENLHQKSQELNLKAMGDNANALLAELRRTNQKLVQTLESPALKELMADARGTVKGLNAMVKDARPPLNQTLTDLGRAAKSARNITQELETTFPGRLQDIGHQADTTLVQMEKTIKLLENLVWTNAEPLNRTLENFQQASENLKQLSRDLKLYPGRILEDPPESPQLQKEGN